MNFIVKAMGKVICKPVGFSYLEDASAVSEIYLFNRVNTLRALPSKMAFFSSLPSALLLSM